jgi:glycosyltransferase involved in cell wall biosynthesis
MGSRAFAEPLPQRKLESRDSSIMVPVSKPIRVLAIIEAAFVTGPAKNLITFATRAPEVELSIVTFHRISHPPNKFVIAAADAGLQVFVLSEKRRFDFGPISDLRSVVGKVRPDIVQSHNTKSHLFVRLAGLHRRYPWIAFNHGYTTADWKDRVYNQVDRWTLPAAGRVVTVCAPFARDLQRLGVQSQRIRIRHNSVSPFIPPTPDAIESVREKFQLGRDPVILTVGRLSREKGNAHLLQAVALLASRGRLGNARVVIAGDGPERDALQVLASRLGIAGQVALAGFQSDVRPFYSLATLLAVASYSEGSPNVVLEAMSAGVPVVATAVGGVPEILDSDHTGLIVEPRNAPAMAGAIERLLCGEDLRCRFRRAALSSVTARYSPDAYCRDLVAIYEDVLRR